MLKTTLIAGALVCVMGMQAMAEPVVADTVLLTERTANAFTPRYGTSADTAIRTADSDGSALVPATVLWPFSKNDDDRGDAPKLKSTRKAFFLSMLCPGLGEAYVGSKRSLLFLGIEAAAWWMYMTNTKEGNNLEDDFHEYADSHWHYTDTQDSNGDALDYNYFNWIVYQVKQGGYSGTLDPTEYARIDSLLEATTENPNADIFGYSVHNIPPTKTQQYYEMIGKYPQFVYGWEDIDDLNARLQDEGYKVPIRDINSSMRMHYETMRDDSNQKLKAGQRGIHLMLINRVVSAIDAGRLAYHHNQKINSELSMVRVNFVQKRVIDTTVPMIMLTKRF